MIDSPKLGILTPSHHQSALVLKPDPKRKCKLTNLKRGQVNITQESNTAFG